MRFFSTFSAISNAGLSYQDPFIVQWEIPYPKTDATRKYIVFENISEYLTYYKQGRYTTCHEVFVGKTYNQKEDIYGHPAFDIDAEYDKYTLEHDWKLRLINDLRQVIEVQYPTKKVEDLAPIWMDSSTSLKVSKHLLISGITFPMWRGQMKIIHTGLLSLYEDKDVPNYIKALDQGILRTTGSLRLPLNSKCPNPLKETPKIVFEDPKHKFEDGLIMCHNENLQSFKDSTILMPSMLTPDLQSELDYCGFNKMLKSLIYNNNNQIEGDEGEFAEAFNLWNSKWNTGLEPGGMNGQFMTLNRKFPGKCPISDRIHDTDNAYLFMCGSQIHFGCHRGCQINIGGFQKKSISIQINTSESNRILDKWIKYEQSIHV